MMSRELAYRYAKALFGLSDDMERSQRWATSLEDVAGQIDRSLPLQRALQAPQLSSEDKLQILQPALGEERDPTLMRFLSLLLEKRRMQILSWIAQFYHQMLREQADIAEVNVFSAVPLDEAEVTELTQKMEKRLQKRVQLTQQIDRKLLGGLLLIIGNQMVDLSMRRRIGDLEKYLVSAPT